jgi:hypothetical protein
VAVILSLHLLRLFVFRRLSSFWFLLTLTHHLALLLLLQCMAHWVTYISSDDSYQELQHGGMSLAAFQCCCSEENPLVFHNF